jgi:hypothetical protein
VYSLFEKYLAFLREHNFYDPNILAHDYLRHVRQTYDFVVIDEVQDITNIQLQLPYEQRLGQGRRDRLRQRHRQGEAGVEPANPQVYKVCGACDA